jgi:hypothetical protein
MTQAADPSLLARIDALEHELKQCRRRGRWTRTGLNLLTLAWLASVLAFIELPKRFGVFTDGTVTARALRVVGDGSVGRITMGIDDQAYLVMADRTGAPRLSAIQNGDVTTLRLVDRGQRCVQLSVGDGAQELTFYDAPSTPRLALGVNTAREAVLTLNDLTAQSRLSLAVSPDDTAGLTLTDADCRPRLIIANKGGAPLMNFFDERQQLRLSLGQSGQGWPALEMVSSDGKPRVALYAPDDWTSLTFNGANGKPQLQAYIDEDGQAQQWFASQSGELLWQSPPAWYNWIRRALAAEPVP